MEAGGIQEYQHRSRLVLLKAIEQILVFSFFHAIGPLGLLIKANRAKPTDRCHVSISAACCRAGMDKLVDAFLPAGLLPKPNLVQ